MVIHHIHAATIGGARSPVDPISVMQWKLSTMHDRLYYAYVYTLPLHCLEKYWLKAMVVLSDPFLKYILLISKGRVGGGGGQLP